MRFSLAVAALAPVLSVYAENILVQVGAGGKLAFSPTNITAKVGDTVAFQFQGKNHSVTQSSFADPCHVQTTPAQGVDSGFQFVAINSTQLPEWSITINNDTSPLWFFCAQTVPASHCNAGMVFSINANPDSAKSFAVYQAAAMADNNVAAAPSASATDGGDSSAPTGTDSATAASPTGTDSGSPTDASDSAATDTAAGSATDSAGNPLSTDSSSASGADSQSAVASASASAPIGAATDSASAPSSLASAPTAGNNAVPVNAGTNAADNAAPSSTASGTTGAGFRLGTNTGSLLAVVGLAAGLLL